jgi:hypothetical protein
MNNAPLLKRMLQAIVFNTVIALGMTVFGEYTLSSNLVFSQCVGLCSWGADRGDAVQTDPEL